MINIQLSFFTIFCFLQANYFISTIQILMEENSRWVQLLILIVIICQIKFLSQSFKNFFTGSLQNFIRLSKCQNTQDFILIYFLSKFQMQKRLIVIYLNCILIRFQHILVKQERLKYSNSQLFRKIFVKEVIMALCDLLIVEIMIKYFFGELQHQNLPNLFTLMVIANSSYSHELDLIGNVTSYFRIFHFFFLKLNFEFDHISSKIFTVYFILKVVETNYYQGKKIKHQFQEINMRTCLQKLNY
ncbi:hypothetical protein ABPG72_010832 [Tetrahymena utriculariae]